ncbi:hypothetical protein ACP275_04G111700 [Erythranthe tilingii]
MKITVKKSTMVTPNAATPSGKLWLSNVDLVTATTYHTRSVYYYRFSGAADFFDPAVLMAALSRVLVEYYPIAGRLTRDEDGRISINCTAEGALFVEAECDGEIDDLGGFGPRPDLSLNPAVDYSLGISTYPLLLIQLTRFKCGGVCLGHGNQHHLSDGPAALRFTKTWFDLARSIATATATATATAAAAAVAPPFMDRTLLRARDPPQPRFTHIEYHRGGTPPPQPNSEKTYSVFKLTSDQINALKAKCNVGSGNGGNGPFPATRYTTFEVLAGHVWRCVSEARGLPGDQETKLFVSTDGRSRLSPPLPPGYFGNVNFSATAAAPCGQLRSNHVRFAAGKTREAIARMDDEYLRSAIDYLEVQPDISAIARGPGTYNSPNLGIISWLRLPVYEADFGWGNPVHVGLAAAPPEGKCHFLPSPASDGSLLVSISLAKEHMRLFEKLLFDV